MRVGVDRRTGGVLLGWPHCQQSLEAIFTTALGTRCMRRSINGIVPDMQDKPQNTASFVRFVSAIANACKLYEPGFKVSKVQVVRFGADGVAGFDIAGTFYPDGHLGIFAGAVPVSGRYAASGLLAPLSLGVSPA